MRVRDFFTHLVMIVITCQWHDFISYCDTSHTFTHLCVYNDSTVHFHNNWILNLISTRHRQTLDIASMHWIHLKKCLFFSLRDVYFQRFDWRNCRCWISIHFILFSLFFALWNQWNLKSTFSKYLNRSLLNNMHALVRENCKQKKNKERINQHFSTILHKYMYVCACVVE